MPLESLDVSQAFLRQDESPELQENFLYIVPPKNLKYTDKVWKMKKYIYGMGNAPNKWYLTMAKKILL